VSSAALAQTRSVDAWLARAEHAHRLGQHERARRFWLRAIAVAPRDGRAPIRLAEVLPEDSAAVAEPSALVRARAQEAERAFDAYFEAGGDDVRARRLSAWAAAVGGDHARAIEAAAGLAGLSDVESATLLSRLAALAVRRRDLRAARRALEAANRALPQDNDVLSDLGAVELALGDPDRAAEHFARILGRRPEDLSARRDLAGALVAAGRANEAVALLAQAVERHANEPELRLELAYAALEAGQAQLAERAARAAIAALGADDGRGYAALGSALALQHRRAPAERAFREALRRDPNDARARQSLDALRAQ
jgi:tetratricopeptide (TPR) repeat protein